MVYGIFHKFEVDGGFGDAIYNEELLGVTTSMSKAHEFVNKYQLIDESKLLGEGEIDSADGIVYDVPYNYLHMGALVIRELKEVNLDECPYDDWILSEAYDFNKDNDSIKKKIENIMK